MTIKTLITLMCIALAGCSMTPTQKRWTAIGVSVVATGLILAHETDHGRGPLSPEPSASGSGKGRPSFVCTSQTPDHPMDCK